MGANGALLLDLAGIARHVQITTCAHYATWRIFIIKGIRLSELTKAGAKGEFDTKLWKPLTRDIFLSVAKFNQAILCCLMKGSNIGSQMECCFFVKRENRSTEKNLSDLSKEPTKSNPYMALSPVFSLTKGTSLEPECYHNCAGQRTLYLKGSIIMSFIKQQNKPHCFYIVFSPAYYERKI